MKAAPTPTALVRVVDLETGGSGPQEVCEIGWQDVFQTHDGRWQLDLERGSLMVNPGRPISPETMAVHPILDRDVAGDLGEFNEPFPLRSVGCHDAYSDSLIRDVIVTEAIRS